MTLYEWVSTVLSLPDSFESSFIISVICATLIVVAVVLCFSLFIGIAFAIFRR